MPTVDVVIIGGSYAGVQAAHVLGRARRQVVVIDADGPRNGPAAAVRSFFGPDAPAPWDLLAAGRAALAPYDVQHVGGRVARVRRVADIGFRTETADGSAWHSAAILLATGIRDVLPDVTGVRELWGRDVVACPHCHGWEVRDQPLALLGLRGRPELGVARAQLVRGWSADIVLCTDGDELSRSDREALARLGVAVRTAAVRELAHEGGRLRGVVFEDGSELRRSAVFVAFVQTQQAELADQLGCRLRGDGFAIDVDDAGATSVEGVWAAGSMTAPSLLALAAAGHGGQVATAIHSALGA